MCTEANARQLLYSVLRQDPVVTEGMGLLLSRPVSRALRHFTVCASWSQKYWVERARTLKATAHGPSVMATGPINPAVHKVSDFAHVLVARCLLSIERPRNKLQEVTGLGPVLHDLYPVEFTLFLGPCCNVHGKAMSILQDC